MASRKSLPHGPCPIRIGPGLNHSQSLMDGNFEALWSTDLISTALKDLNLLKKYIKIKQLVAFWWYVLPSWYDLIFIVLIGKGAIFIRHSCTSPTVLHPSCENPNGIPGENKKNKGLIVWQGQRGRRGLQVIENFWWHYLWMIHWTKCFILAKLAWTYGQIIRNLLW